MAGGVGEAATDRVTVSVDAASLLESLAEVLAAVLLLAVLVLFVVVLVLPPQAVRDRASARVKVKDKSFFITSFPPYLFFIPTPGEGNFPMFRR
jgi:hypothetical protein